MCRETFHRCVHLIDQYSHSRPVPKQRIQLLGISCLFISAKLVEKIPPSITAFAASTDGGCVMENIKLKERVNISGIKIGICYQQLPTTS